jgi:hydroxylamine reductase (hybrid-cluster protein)
MNPDLEAIVGAGEEARARVDAAQATAQAGVQAAAEARERHRQERYEALRKATDDEERQIQEAAERAVADRQAIRSRYRETRRLAAEGALAQAADLYAQILLDGPSGIPK